MKIPEKIRYVRGEEDGDLAAGSGKGDHGEGYDRTGGRSTKERRRGIRLRFRERGW